MLIKKLYNLINFFLDRFGFRIIKASSKEKNIFKSYLFLKNNFNNKSQNYRYSFLYHLSKNYLFSYSEKFQDLFVDWVLNLKKNGNFIEFGACNGVYLSNTFFLEKKRNWRGILLEPARCYYKDLIKYRKKSIILNKIVSSCGQQKVNFNESNFQYKDYSISNNLNKNKNYKVETISLNDLIKLYKFKNIDFVSIDTDGSEYDIIKSFDFKKVNIKVIIVEHNYSKKRKLIQNILTANNYINVFPEFSAHDDWFILEKIYNKKFNVKF